MFQALIKFFKTSYGDKLLYLTIGFGLLFVTLHLSNKQRGLENLISSLETIKQPKQASNQTVFKSEDEVLAIPKIRVNHQGLLKPYYCGLYNEQILIFKFARDGKVSAWVDHLSHKSYVFPPFGKPQFVNSYHIKEDYLFWNINIFGNPFHFKAKLISNDNKMAEQLILRSGDTYFSPLNCQILKKLL